MINKNPKKIKMVLARCVEQVLPSKESLEKAMKKKLVLYLGIDPTSPKIHLGHAVCLRKLREFQDLGHEVILLFGTFTAQIGDPTGKDKRRRVLTIDEIGKNISTYKKQVSKILDTKKIKIKHNAVWLGKMSFKDIIRMASYFTVSRILERDMFQERMKKEGEVWLNELLYPLMQGYDSVAMDVDLEVGGSDQTFNMLVGRKLQRIYNKKKKFVLTLPLLIGLDGRKMSKSYGNVVDLTDPPSEMYGKIMSLKDGLIIHYFNLCTDLSLKKIKAIEKRLKSKTVNPKKEKARLAREIVGIYYGEAASKKAEKEFDRVFKDKKTPSQIKRVKVKEKRMNVLDFLLKTGQVKSKSEAKRLILQKAVKIDNSLKIDWRENVLIKKGSVVKIGKRKFVKII